MPKRPVWQFDQIQIENVHCCDSQSLLFRKARIASKKRLNSCKMHVE